METTARIRAERTAADLPGRLHAPHGDKFRALCTERRQIAPFAFETLGETIVPSGGGAANWLGLTNQNPVRSVYLTSGRGRRLLFGKHPVELRHAPRWQLAALHSMAGVVIRALAWLGLHEVENSLDSVLPWLTQEDLDELAAARAVMPRWRAEPLSTRLAHG